MSYLSCFHSNRVSTKNTSTTCPHGTQQWHCDRAAVQLQLINCDDARLKRNRAYKIILVKPIRFNELHHNHKHKLFTLLEHSETFRACTSSPTSNSNLELPKLVLCFCQKLSGLMMRATWMQDGNDSWRIFNKGLMLSHLEPRISTMTVKPCLATSSLRERKKGVISYDEEYIDVWEKSYFQTIFHKYAILGWLILHIWLATTT